MPIAEGGLSLRVAVPRLRRRTSATQAPTRAAPRAMESSKQPPATSSFPQPNTAQRVPYGADLPRRRRAQAWSVQRFTVLARSSPPRARVAAGRVEEPGRRAISPIPSLSLENERFRGRQPACGHQVFADSTQGPAAGVAKKETRNRSTLRSAFRIASIQGKPELWDFASIPTSRL